MIGAVRAAAGDPMALARLLWRPLLVLALAAALYLWAHGRGETEGREEGAKALAAVTEQRARALGDLESAKAANASQEAAIAVLKAANASWASEADRLADEGLAAVQAEERRAQKAQAEAKQWAARYAKETGKPKCAAALAALPLACPNLERY